MLKHFNYKKKKNYLVDDGHTIIIFHIDNEPYEVIMLSIKEQ